MVEEEDDCSGEQSNQEGSGDNRNGEESNQEISENEHEAAKTTSEDEHQEEAAKTKIKECEFAAQPTQSTRPKKCKNCVSTQSMKRRRV
ncbi:hypothetical protein LguiB_030594 [Lonicera macranthoides]